MQAESQDQLIQTALRAGYVDASGVAKAFESLRTRRQKDSAATLEDVLVEEDLLTAAQLAEQFPDLAPTGTYADVPMRIIGSDLGGRGPKN